MTAAREARIGWEVLHQQRGPTLKCISSRGPSLDRKSCSGEPLPRTDTGPGDPVAGVDNLGEGNDIETLDLCQPFCRDLHEFVAIPTLKSKLAQFQESLLLGEPAVESCLDPVGGQERW